jgi:hypothetical protein
MFARMNKALPDALIASPIQPLLIASLPDPNDEHVLAAAVATRARFIVTFNVKDFPHTQLTPHGVVSIHPDDLILHLLRIAASEVVHVIREQAAALRKPSMTPEELLDHLARDGLVRSAVAIRLLLEEAET